MYFYLYCISYVNSYNANSVDPGQPRSVASDLCLHYLPRSPAKKKNALHKWIKPISHAYGFQYI